MSKKIIFIDVDGTLVSYENILPESAKEAIRLARNNGHIVYLCTGRSKAEMPQYLWDIGIDGYIGGNGNYIEHNGEAIFFKPMTLEETTSVVDWLKKRNLEFYLESNNGLFASDNFIERSRDVFLKYMDTKNIPHTDDFETSDLFPDLVSNENLYRDDVNKISFILNSYQDHLDSKNEFNNLEANTWGGKGEQALFGDLGVNNIDKAVAIEKVLEHLNIDVLDTIAIGDAKIDIPMLEYCHIGVAVESGGPEIKAMADYVTDAVMDDGIYNAFKHFELID